MYLLDSDLRGPIADYTFHYRRQFAGKNAPRWTIRIARSNRTGERVSRAR